MISNTTFIGNNSNAVASSSMDDFVILKKFNVKVHPHKAPQIIEILRLSPIFTRSNAIPMTRSIMSHHHLGAYLAIRTISLFYVFAENTGQGVNLC